MGKKLVPIMSPTPPKETNVLWLDTSGDNIMPKVFSDGWLEISAKAAGELVEDVEALKTSLADVTKAAINNKVSLLLVSSSEYGDRGFWEVSNVTQKRGELAELLTLWLNNKISTILIHTEYPNGSSLYFAETPIIITKDVISYGTVLKINAVLPISDVLFDNDRVTISEIKISRTFLVVEDEKGIYIDPTKYFASSLSVTPTKMNVQRQQGSAFLRFHNLIGYMYNVYNQGELKIASTKIVASISKRTGYLPETYLYIYLGYDNSSLETSFAPTAIKFTINTPMYLDEYSISKETETLS